MKKSIMVEKAWWSKTAHLMAARKQRKRERKRPATRYTLQRHFLQLSLTFFNFCHLPIVHLIVNLLMESYIN
jgi:hypothetical protein